MSRIELFGRLRLRTVGASDEGRHASALELFFDLVFVVAVAALGKMLADNTTLIGFGQFALLFVPVWWAWVGYAFYADRFESSDVTHRVLVMGAMLAIAGVAVNTGQAFHSDAAARGVAASYVIIRLLLITLYVRAHVQEPLARPLSGRYIGGFVVGASCWGASLLLPAPARYWLWAAGLLVELVTPLLSARAIARVPYHASHISDRLGGFTIIVLGETVVLATTGAAAQQLQLAGALIGVVGFMIAACLWWTYFDFVDSSPLRRWLVAGQIYVYGHLMIFAGITATGEGVLLATRAAGSPLLEGGARWALAGGLAAFLFTIGIIHLVNSGRTGDVRTWSPIGAGAACILVAGLGGTLSPLFFESILMAVVLVHLLVAARLHDHPSSEPPGASAAGQ